MKFLKINLIVFLMAIFITNSALAQLSFTFFPPEEEYTASEELDKQLLTQTVSVLIIGDGLGSCSGTIIAEDADNHYVLTAKHCVEVTEEMYVEHNPVLYSIVSSVDDLALLVVDGKIKDKTVAKIAKINPILDEAVYHVAYPNGVLYKRSGKVTRFTKDWILFNFQAIGGCSGGGVFNETGELVSVLWGGYRNAESDSPIKSLAEPALDIRTFLKSINLRVLQIL